MKRKPAKKIYLADDLSSLYIGQNTRARGAIRVGEGKPRPAQFRGHGLFYGHLDEEAFILERLERVALRGWLDEPGERDRIGILSLVGPVEEVSLPHGPSGSIEDILMELHYRALSPSPDKRRQIYEEGRDAFFPEVEYMTAKLVWSQPESSDEGSNLLTVELTANLSSLKQWGSVTRVTVEPTIISLRQFGSTPAWDVPLSSLNSHCPPPPAQPCLPGPEVPVQLLPIKFVNFFEGIFQAAAHIFPQAAQPGQVEAICREQMAGVCEVWRNKAALELVVWPNTIGPAATVSGSIDDGVDCRGTFHDVNVLEETTIAQTKYRSDEHICVYLVDKIDPNYGGGAAFDCGKPAAYVILDLHAAKCNKYLLAHELGHVLGLDDATSNTANAGSMNSIMDPTHLASFSKQNCNQPAAGGNSPVNTIQNCEILLSGSLNQIVEPSGIDGCFFLDQE